MKRYLFLIVLIFIVIINVFENNSISVKMTLVDQNINSKTKESPEIHMSKVEADTEDDIKNVNQEDIETKENTEIQENIEIQENAKIQDNVENNFQNNSQSQQSILIIPEYVIDENIKLAEEEVLKIPQKWIDVYRNDGWTINLTNDDISNKYFGGIYKKVMGVTIVDSNMIVIENTEKSIQSSIVHEFGHYIDYKFNFPSMNEEFLEIYREEVSTFKSRIPNSGCVSNELEFFAHTFYYLIEDPSKCTPKAEEFVQRYINRI